MPEVSAASTAMHGGSGHAVGLVFSRSNGFLDRCPKARPTRAAVEFCRRGEIFEIASGAGKIALPLLVKQWAGEGALGPRLTKHGVLVGLQQLAPFLIGVRDLEGLGGREGAIPPRQSGRRRADRPAQQKKPPCQHDADLRSIAAANAYGAIRGGVHIVTGIGTITRIFSLRIEDSERARPFTQAQAVLASWRTANWLFLDFPPHCRGLPSPLPAS